MLSKDRNTLIQQAYINAGIVSVSSDITAEEMTTASYTLNSMIKGWETEGFHIWKEKEAFLLCSKSQLRYTLGGEESDHCTEKVYETKVDSVTIPPIYSITLADIEDLNIGDIVVVHTGGFIVDNKTVVSIDGYRVTLNDGIIVDLSLGDAVFYGTDLVMKLNEGGAISVGTLSLTLSSTSDVNVNDKVYIINTSGVWLERTVVDINHDTHVLTLNNTIIDIAESAMLYIASNLNKTSLASAETQKRNGVILIDDTDIKEGWQIGFYNTPTNTAIDPVLSWFTVDVIVGDTLILSDVIGTDVIGEETVYYYEENIGRPNDISDIRYVENLSDSYENPIAKIARREYLAITDKKATGSPIQAYFEREKESANLYLYNNPDKEYFVCFSYQKTFDVFSDANDNADFPDEYIDCLVWNLAYKLCIIFKVPDISNIKLEADDTKMKAQMWDNEMVSFNIAPEV